MLPPSPPINLQEFCDFMVFALFHIRRNAPGVRMGSSILAWRNGSMHNIGNINIVVFYFNNAVFEMMCCHLAYFRNNHLDAERKNVLRSGGTLSWTLALTRLVTETLSAHDLFTRDQETGTRCNGTYYIVHTVHTVHYILNILYILHILYTTYCIYICCT